MDPGPFERTESSRQLVTVEIEPLVDVLEALLGDGLDAHERPLDARCAHRVEKRGVFGRFHGDLGEEHEIVGQLGELLHQLEPLFAHLLQFVEAALVRLPFGSRQIGEGHRIEVIVGEGDESESRSPELHDLADDRVHGPLAWLLAVGAPDRTERTMLRTAAHGLNRRPHVSAFGQQIPSRRKKLIPGHAATLVDAGGLAGDAVLHDVLPHEVPVTLDDGVCGSLLEYFFGKQRGVDSAEGDPRAALSGNAADLIPAQRVAGMNADADDVTGRDGGRVQRLQRFVDDVGIAPRPRRRRRQHVEPPGRDDGHAVREIARIDQMYASIWHAPSLKSATGRSLTIHEVSALVGGKTEWPAREPAISIDRTRSYRARSTANVGLFATPIIGA